MGSITKIIHPKKFPGRECRPSQDVNEVAFMLWTRSNPMTEQNLTFGDALSVLESDFQLGQPVKILAHGYTDNGAVPWIVGLRGAFLVAGDYGLINVVVVFFALSIS